ncbi:MAG: TRAM domain-containing protein [Elusimicrobia bacterium]|nr:TRAM domain-containing protein [Elusimicrobiota bacterium]
MGIWLFRLFVVVVCPALVYLQVNPTPKGIVLGVLIGVSIVAVEFLVEQVNLLTAVSGLLGGAAGVLLSQVIDYLVIQMNIHSISRHWEEYAVLRYFAFGILGMIVTIRKFPELDELDKDILKMSRRRGAEFKVVDTSAIIDGRVMDICETKFLTGTLVVPRFVLVELQGLSDSPDTLKRARGRRGLDILARLQENPEIPVRIMDKEYPDIPDVDGRVVRLARDLGGRVITTDFNLNKIAALDGVVCLNVNDLALSLKPVVLPGEAMSVFIMKEGKEKEQGIGYLDDGTMVVVEDGRRHIGKRLDVGVTSILQTSAGRMIFGKSRGERG